MFRNLCRISHQANAEQFLYYKLPCQNKVSATTVEQTSILSCRPHNVSNVMIYRDGLVRLKSSTYCNLYI